MRGNDRATAFSARFGHIRGLPDCLHCGVPLACQKTAKPTRTSRRCCPGSHLLRTVETGPAASAVRHKAHFSVSTIYREYCRLGERRSTPGIDAAASRHSVAGPALLATPTPCRERWPPAHRAADAARALRESLEAQSASRRHWTALTVGLVWFRQEPATRQRCARSVKNASRPSRTRSADAPSRKPSAEGFSAKTRPRSVLRNIPAVNARWHHVGGPIRERLEGLSRSASLTAAKKGGVGPSRRPDASATPLQRLRGLNLARGAIAARTLHARASPLARLLRARVHGIPARV